MKGAVTMLPEERARIKIDKQLINAGWMLFPDMNIFRIVHQQLRKR